MKILLKLNANIWLFIFFLLNFSSCGPSLEEITERDRLDKIYISDSIASATMPHFPWPPPKSSASDKIPRNFFVKSKQISTLNQVAKKFETAMDKIGYAQFSYYYVPSGFAIVSQLEQIDPDGTPLPGTKRYNVDFQKEDITSFTSYIKALFIPNPGHFRVIVFLFTSEPYAESPKKMKKKTAQDLVHSGLDRLPKKMGDMLYSEDYECNAKIYQYEQKSINSEVVFINPSPTIGRDHLVKSKIWEELSK